MINAMSLLATDFAVHEESCCSYGRCKKSTKRSYIYLHIQLVFFHVSSRFANNLQQICCVRLASNFYDLSETFCSLVNYLHVYFVSLSKYQFRTVASEPGSASYAVATAFQWMQQPVWQRRFLWFLAKRPCSLLCVVTSSLPLVDVNECVAKRTSPPCARNAVCTNTIGSYQCHCAEGFDGNASVECSGWNTHFLYVSD